MTCLCCGVSITGRGRSGCCQKCASIRQGAGTTGGRMSYIQTDMTSTETTLRARIAELESALRLTLAVSPDDPLVLTPAEQQVVGLEAQVAGLIKALPPADHLRILADWFDADDANKGGGRGNTVQKDLRKWANAIDQALAKAQP